MKRAAALPDKARVAQDRCAPELGPKILFFSGGTALRALSRALKLYTHNSIHLITAFDSGGSSAALREAFGMLSVGDLRNRLLALADESVRGNPEVRRLFSYRLPSDDDPGVLREQLVRMSQESDPLLASVPGPMRQIACTHLRDLEARLPETFDLRGASIGNLILAGGFLRNDRDIDSVLLLFSRLVATRGIVRSVVNANLHLGAELEDGTRIFGQHRLTSRDADSLVSPVKDLFLVEDLQSQERAEVVAAKETTRLVRGAELICYPMGSFYSSVVANLLPRGIGAAIRGAPVPKVYVPNTGWDPEQVGMTLSRSVETLVRFVRCDSGEETPIQEIVNTVLIDTERGRPAMALDLDSVRALGVEVVDLELVTPASDPDIDPERLSQILTSLA